MALLASASISSAADCVSDPNECTLKKLCEASTTIEGSKTIWATTSETAKHVALAQSLGMECGVTPIVDLCETDPNECKVSEICEKATTESAGQKTWDDSAAGHVALAKEYDLNCDVVVQAAGQIKGKNVCNLTIKSACDDPKILCFFARGGDGSWSKSSSHQSYVKEAKKRGLTCGVDEAKATSFNKMCYASSVKGCSAYELCKNSTVPSGKTRVWKPSNSVFVKEAKKRGLTCGVDEAKATKAAKAKTPSSIVLEASKRVCPGNGIGNSCTGVYTHKDGYKWIGRRVNRNLYGTVTLLFLTKDEWEGDVRIGERDDIKNEWSGQSLYVWRNGNARFDFDVPKGTFNSNSTVNEVFPELRRMFNALPKKQRLRIQASLKNKNLYESKIDGAWGRNTLIGLSRFSAEHLNTINLKSEANIELVFKGALEQLNASTTKMTSLSVLESVAKADAEVVKVASRAEDFKAYFLSQSLLYRKQIQYALKHLDYYNSNIDGLWGTSSREAIVTYVQAKNLHYKTSSAVFRDIVSEVNVPTSFTVPKKNNTLARPQKQNFKPNKKQSGWRSFNANPLYSLDQAIAICEPQASIAGEQASQSYRSPSYGSSVKCREYGYIINCDTYEYSGGFWGALADGLGQGKARSSAEKAVMYSCMAKYGWTKK